MKDILFATIADGIVKPSHRPVGSRLTVLDAPDPFVPPIFHDEQDAASSLQEVVIIRASAAVGKSTIAQALSCARQLPVLDLSHTPVATGSLVGLLTDLRNGTDALTAFHAGRLPIIIDALDEGRLRSGENGLFSFFETAAETLAEDRSCIDRPKLIFLGRPDAVGYAQLYFEEKGIKVALLDVGYFDAEGARGLIHAYANKSARHESLYLTHRKPADEYISAYFDRVEAALGIAKGQLWSSEHGRSFAGYAPVLAAIGSLLPEIGNFSEAQQRLRDVGTEDAWGVIESVLRAILVREQGKIIEQFSKNSATSAPDALYSPDEQMALLLQHVNGQALVGAGTVCLKGAEAATYDRLVQQLLPEHPFIRERKFSNDVIASYVLSDAILADRKLEYRLLVEAARQPFLWRSMQSRLPVDAVIDGRFLGFILSSFWSDPLTTEDLVSIVDSDAGSAKVIITSKTGRASFIVISPLSFFGRIKNAKIDVGDTVLIIGAGEGEAKAFIFEGNTSYIAERSSLEASQLTIRGRLWLDSDITIASGQLSLNVDPQAEYGWGPRLEAKYPFSKFPGTLLREDEGSSDDPLVALLDACTLKAPVGASLPFFTDYSVDSHDYFHSIYQKYGEQFSAVIGALVKEGFAEASPMRAAGPPKFRVKMVVEFAVLAAEVRAGGTTPEFKALVGVLRQAMG